MKTQKTIGTKIRGWCAGLFFLSVCLAMSFDAVAETYYLSESNVKQTALSVPSRWKTTAGSVCSEFSYSDNYVNQEKVLFMRTNSLDNGYFEGGSLTIGDTKTGSAVFYVDNGDLIGFAAQEGMENGGGLVLYKGVLALNSGADDKSATIAGRVSVTASAASPFHIHSMTAGNFLNIAADFVSGEDNVLEFGWSHNGGKISNLKIETCRPNVTLRLAGDCSAYLGTLVMTGSVDRVEVSDECEVTSFGTRLILSNTAFAGSVVMNGGCVLAADSPRDICSVATLTLRPDSVVLVPGATEIDEETGLVQDCTNAFFRVTEALDVEGSVRLVLPGWGAVADGTTNKFAVLSVPAGSELDPEKFTVVADGLPPVIHRLVVEETDEEKILFVEVEPFALLMVSDSSSVLRSTAVNADGLPSSLTNAAAWSDGQLPRPGVNAIVMRDPLTGNARYLRTTGGGYRSTKECVFPGRRLIICSGGYLVSHCGTFRSTDCPVTFLDGGVLAYVHSQGTSFVGGLEAREGSFYIRPYVGGVTTVDKLYGSGTIVAGDLRIDNDAISGSYIFKDTSDFTGKFNMQTYRKSAVDADSAHQTLFVSGNALGGVRDEFTPDALRLTDHSTLCVDESAPAQTLSDTVNAGVKVDGFAHADLENSSDRLRIDWPVTYNGTLYKEGAGTLALGGTAKFGDDSVADPVTDGTNDIVLVEGTLEIASSAAIDGCRVTVSNATSLVVKYSQSDEAMLGYGLRNTKTAEPFVLGDIADGKLPLSVDFSEWGGEFPDSVEVALLTVTNLSDTVSAVKAMLPGYVGIIGLDHPYKQTIADCANTEEGSVTFRLKVIRAGLTVTIR